MGLIGDFEYGEKRFVTISIANDFGTMRGYEW